MQRTCPFGGLDLSRIKKPQRRARVVKPAVSWTRMLALLPSLVNSSVSISDVIHLKNGKKLSVDRAWQEGDRIRYEKNGNVFGFPKEFVAKIEANTYLANRRESSVSAPSSLKQVPIEVIDETLDLGQHSNDLSSGILANGKIDHERLSTLEKEARSQSQDPQKRIRYLNALRDLVLWHIKQNDLNSAMSFMEPYLHLDPYNLQANLTLSWLHLKRGEHPQAENVLLQAKVKNDRSPDLYYLLGMAYYHQDKNELALRTLRQSLQLRYRPEVEQLLKKVEQENRAENDYRQANTLHFVLRYEGSAANQALGRGILASLEQSFSELERQLDFSPRATVAVVLYPDEVFHDVTRTPGWVGALNDGKIRFPIKGLSFVDENVRKILKHELTHSFIRQKTAGNCPLWLNEGLAQYLSGDTSEQFVRLAKQTIAENRFTSLDKLEGSFLGLGVAQAAWAYQESLLAAEFLVKSYGLSDVQILLDRIGQTGSFQIGLKATFRKDYSELHQEFEQYVKRQ
jgi:tetratricopeptide (TPR) repeat protein